MLLKINGPINLPKNLNKKFMVLILEFLLNIIKIDIVVYKKFKIDFNRY